MNKRTIAAPIIGLLAFGGAYAFAATLGLDSDNLGADDEVVASCDSSVATSYGTSYDDGQDRFEVTTLTVSAYDDECDNEVADFKLTDGGTIVGAGGGSLEADGSTDFAVNGVPTASATPSAEAVDGVHLVITGDSEAASDTATDN